MEGQVMTPEGRGRAPGALEREILACLAAAGRPLSPADVRAELGDQLAYTTVMTTLSRLHAKGAVTRQAAGRGYAYELRGDPDDAQASMTAHRMLRLLEAGGNRAGVLSRFVADLSPGDEQLLAGLLTDDAEPGAEQPGAEQPDGGQP
jgi:predicted transcriptional regulator